MSAIIIERKTPAGFGGDGGFWYRYVEVDTVPESAELAPKNAKPCDWQPGEPPTVAEKEK